MAMKRHLAWAGIGLVVMPIAVYLSAYLPFFLTGHTVSQFIELQRQMYVYHSRLVATHAYQLSWWSWPLALRPVWYYVSYGESTIANIYAQGNPLLYWAFLPALTWLIFRWWGKQNAALAVFAIGFFGQWLPWALVPRISFLYHFLYHFLPVVPFGCLAVAIGLADLWRQGNGWRLVTVSYTGLVLNAFVFFYPIYTAVPLREHAFEMRIWLDSWR